MDAALRRVTEFRKLLEVERSQKYGSIFFKYQGSRSMKRLDLGLVEFLCVSHMLENDIVFYNPRRKYFQSINEIAETKPLTPRT